MDCARPPTVPVADFEHGRFEVDGGSGGRGKRPARVVGERLPRVESGEPLVGRLAGDFEVAGDRGDGPLGRADGVDEGSADLGHAG